MYMFHEYLKMLLCLHLLGQLFSKNSCEQKWKDLTLGYDLVVDGDDGKCEWDVYMEGRGGGSVLFKYDKNGGWWRDTQRENRERERLEKRKTNLSLTEQKMNWTSFKTRKNRKERCVERKGKNPKIERTKEIEKMNKTENEKEWQKGKTNWTEKKES